jgi:uncharacterized protein (TIGR02646 family)
MQKINRPFIENIQSLKGYKERLNQYCQECEKGTRKWQSSGEIYKLLKIELNNLTQGHCSFCDGYPFSMSKETIEHYYPKAEFKEKTYKWENLFICCDKCQSNANKVRFEYTLKPDDNDYLFDYYFWFNAENGEINILENLSIDKKNKANAFLNRYGINSNTKVLSARKRLYKDLIILMQKNPIREREDEPHRYIYDAVVEYLSLKKL